MQRRSARCSREEEARAKEEEAKYKEGGRREHGEVSQEEESMLKDINMPRKSSVLRILQVLTVLTPC